MVARSRGTVLGVAAVVLAAAAVVAVVALVKSAPSGASRATAAAQPSGTTASPPGAGTPSPATTVNPAVGPAMPAHGAYIGAYVQPDSYSVSGTVAAIQALQSQLGRRLDIVHSYLKWRVPFPRPSQQAIMDQGSILLLSWTSDDTRVIASGRDDGWIRRQARAMKAAHRPIFLEWRWEMNRPSLYGQVQTPADYVAAWDHMRSIFGQEHVKNVAWVWCPTSKGFAATGPAYYPGNSEVDWLCADIYPPPYSYAPFAQLADPFLSWAAHIAKPVMIGEYGAPHTYSPQQRAAWLLGVAQMARLDPQIKALMYFDGDPAGEPRAGQFALDPGSAPLRAFRQIAREPYFNPSRPPGPGGSG
jgi:hypothetical protein